MATLHYGVATPLEWKMFQLSNMGTYMCVFTVPVSQVETVHGTTFRRELSGGGADVRHQRRLITASIPEPKHLPTQLFRGNLVRENIRITNALGLLLTLFFRFREKSITSIGNGSNRNWRSNYYSPRKT